jgi:hypothetical protein
MKVKSKYQGLSIRLADLFKATCKLLRMVGENEAYIKSINLPKHYCEICKTETGTIECEEYTICTLCLKDKKIKLF